jgi:hypothetical protein
VNTLLIELQRLSEFKAWWEVIDDMLGKDKPFELLLMRHYSIDSYSKYVFVRVETFIITIIMQQQIVVTDRFNQSIYQFDFLLTTSINEMFELLYLHN